MNIFKHHRDKFHQGLEEDLEIKEEFYQDRLYDLEDAQLSLERSLRLGKFQRHVGVQSLKSYNHWVESIFYQFSERHQRYL
ncbi:hypothetical protein MHO82_25655, partial [Vibrio sp. Of7-15]|uniref:hypothetical protein n=1 Tax=Vibrio sp. Of7-15 TaxID=2724879 RepID=UPI001EF25629